MGTGGSSSTPEPLWSVAIEGTISGLMLGSCHWVRISPSCRVSSLIITHQAAAACRHKPDIDMCHCGQPDKRRSRVWGAIHTPWFGRRFRLLVSTSWKLRLYARWLTTLRISSLKSQLIFQTLEYDVVELIRRSRVNPLSYSSNVLSILGPEISLPHSQEPETGPYSEPDEFNPHPSFLFI
jgi:hypothetical protein